jgi:hypothetical protein
MPELYGASCQPLEQEEILAVLEYIFSPTSTSIPRHLQEEPRQWALVQCTDTTAWAVHTPQGWRWSQEADPAVRIARQATLEELRLFGPRGEYFLWRQGEWTFAGRWLTQTETVEPLTEEAVLRAPLTREVGFVGGVQSPSTSPLFQKRKTTGGNITVPPSGWGVVLQEFLEEDEATGTLRVAATRCVELLTSNKPEVL